MLRSIGHASGASATARCHTGRILIRQSGSEALIRVWPNVTSQLRAEIVDGIARVAP